MLARAIDGRLDVLQVERFRDVVEGARRRASMALSMFCSPLIMMTTVSGACLSTCGNISSPVMPPIMMSLRTRSKLSPATRSKASSPELTSAHS